MKTHFVLCSGTPFENAPQTKPVQTALAALRRDLAACAGDTHAYGAIQFEQKPEFAPEGFALCVESDTITVSAADDLGFVYALYTISERFLNVPPFWFWMDTPLRDKSTARVPCGSHTAPPCVLRYRGWFINDEVLLDFMAEHTGTEQLWDMAFEALLRCRGNLVIPGTDKNAHRFRQKASDCGLWISHHHAEPMGAEMFCRAFPDLQASYRLYPEKYVQLWRQALAKQADTPTIYTLGFRGQGDRPFWADDPVYDTPEKRGMLISEIMNLQYALVQEINPGAPCCTNLYGEMMELYQEGHLQLHPEIIAIWADNGYGKMVSRRQGNSNPRVPALPSGTGRNGVYYHVSFYDLQAANHVTLLPNSAEFVARELTHAMACGVHDYCIVNCSNIRPHVFHLDLLRKLWQGSDTARHAQEFAALYYGGEQAAVCLSQYASCTPRFGEHEDERAGEQFYPYSVRSLACRWMQSTQDGAKDMRWATGDCGLAQQMQWLQKICVQSEEKFTALLAQCERVQGVLPRDYRGIFARTFTVQVRVHLVCLAGVALFAQAYEAYTADDIKTAFYKAGLAGERFLAADAALRRTETGAWRGFYANECLSDCKFTRETLDGLMHWLRAMCDGPHFFAWQRALELPPDDVGVMLITHMRNRWTTEELFRRMKQAQQKQEEKATQSGAQAKAVRAGNKGRKPL